MFQKLYWMQSEHFSEETRALTQRIQTFQVWEQLSDVQWQRRRQ